MGDGNYFATRDQVLFICYKDIIKEVYPLMMMSVVENYYDDLNDIMKLEEIKNYDIFNMQRLCVERTHVNPLVHILREQTEENIKLANDLLDVFEKEFIEMYTLSDLTDFGAKIFTLAKMQNVKNIYIYSEKPLQQIVYDCKTYYHDIDKIKYVCGDLKSVVEALPEKPTTFIINDVTMIDTFLDMGFSFVEFIVAEMAYNFEVTKSLDLVLKNNYYAGMQDKIYKLGILPIIKLESKHFSCLEEYVNVRDNDESSTDGGNSI